MKTMLECIATGVRAGRKTILADTSLAFAAGETVALVGPNGAGKSTLLRMLAGELAPSSGRVVLKGRALASYAPRCLARHRAVLSQSITVAFPFTVAEIVAMGAGDAHPRNVAAVIDQALQQVELGGFGGRVFTTLSGGEQQRAHFARVLVQLACAEAAHGPGLMLLDEPTASLDLKHQLTLVACSKRCAGRGTAVLAIMHDLNLATLFADRIVVLERGRVVADGLPHNVVTNALLRQVFGVSGCVGRTPSGGAPFVLPHEASTIGDAQYEVKPPSRRSVCPVM